MTSHQDIQQFGDRLRESLGEGAVVEITPAREPGRWNLWVVGQGASDVVSELLSETAVDLDDPFASVQAYEDDHEASRLGVRLGGALDDRSDWLSGVQTASPAVGDTEPRFDPPLVVAFYSFRGGVGRTTAVAHTAAVLADRGRKVVVVDADLEAPGLHHAFGVPGATKTSNKPLLDLLARLQRNGNEPVDARDYMVEVPGYEDLYVLAAGDPSEGYLEALDALNFRSWTQAAGNPVEKAIELVAGSALAPDVVLVDARTGFTDTNAPFLFGGSDHVVLVFFPSEQSKSGIELVARALAGASSRRGSPVGLHFIASPIPSGPGASTDAAVVERAKQWATDWTSSPDGDVVDPDFLAVPYAEALALADRITTDETLLEPFTEVADWIDPYETPTGGVDEVSKIRSQLNFTAGNSDASDQDISELFVRTEDAEKVRNTRVLLVEGRKGTGKTTLFRWLRDEEGAIAITAPESLRSGAWWPTREVWAHLAESDPDFHRTWPVLIALRAAEELPEVGGRVPDVLKVLQLAQDGGVLGLSQAVEHVSGTTIPSALAASDLMVRTLSALPESRRLVFDGLDTTFGYSAAERQLRDRAIGSLLPLLMDREASLPTVTFTVFVRTDIVRGISFANQSHLFGRRLTLSWEKEDYLKTVLKQALTSSEAFSRHVGVGADAVDELTNDKTLQLWYALLGVRVRGKQTAFTDRWVWTRLADGNGDHSPRHLAQLFRVLADRSRNRLDEPGPPLRARDLGLALSEVVSQEALTAVRDEFATEVDQVLPVFVSLEQSPFSRQEWETAGGDAGKLAIAETMGLVATHPRDRDRLIVPELYRYALDVRRRGPA